MKNILSLALGQLSQDLLDLTSGRNTNSAITDEYLTDRHVDIDKVATAIEEPALYVERKCYQAIIKQAGNAVNKDMHSLNYTYHDLANLIVKNGGANYQIDQTIKAIMLRLQQKAQVKVKGDGRNKQSIIFQICF